ncbi:hypothetical protein NM208_g4501 [Fusarium decemcellulare]|uniref:Uncharacterized protein n=1 Tax=Fusarium decemcellulare TaxID=57161 RepID=A0ACC1SKD2_9HYPO|nr:hypothetical protein NM208_g4501 [Fusarium decemcellulare]
MSPDKTANYVAFTHCWGSAKSLKLLKNNQEHLCTGIQVRDLPQSYQEAIATCLGLELEFIWIDSLCIIQDSETDWQQEAATMGTLYGSAALNLCAAAAADNSEASFTARDLSLINPLRISCDWEGEGKGEFNVVSIDLQFVDIRSSPLRSRGWIFQEMSLSSSSLLLGRMQLWWHCREKLACDTFPDGLPKVFSSFWLADVESIKDKNHETPADRDQWRAMWHARCRQYTQTKFTKERDRLIAFSGVVQKFQNTYAIPNDYVAGLWRFELPAALCWSVSGIGKVSRSPEYKAPSWSWMSLDGPINLNGVGGSVETQTCCSVEQLWLHHLDETHITGLLRGGALKLRGHLIGPSTIHSDGVLTYELVTEAHDASDTIRKDRVFGLGWDEKDTNSAGMISYLDNLDPDRCQRGFIDEAVRRIISTKHADGSIFYLPITHKQNEPNGTWSLNGIILYQAPNQPKVFHRINDYVLQCSEGTHDNFMAKLSIQHPMRSILIL